MDIRKVDIKLADSRTLLNIGTKKSVKQAYNKLVGISIHRSTAEQQAQQKILLKEARIKLKEWKK